MQSPTQIEMPLFLLVLNLLIVFLLNHSMLYMVQSYYPLCCFTKEASPTEYGLSENLNSLFTNLGICDTISLANQLASLDSVQVPIKKPFLMRCKIMD